LQQQTPGVAIIEPLAPEVPAVPPQTDAGGTVVTPGSPAIPAEEPGDFIRWRSVDGRQTYSEKQNRDTSRQIEVREREEDNEDLPGRKKNVIEVVGNDYTTNESSVRKFTIDINDGLITNFLKQDADSEGWWGTVQWVDLSSSATIVLTFEAGILKKVFSGAYGVGIEEPGTEAAPGVVSREF
jgi:hypothetical protein